jgi:hypothetical protein
MLTGGCQGSCNAKGALFCNGQYVDVSAAELDACLLEFAPSLAGGFECEGVTCTGAASASCSTSSPGDAPFDFAAAGALVLGVGVIATRRRRPKK